MSIAYFDSSAFVKLLIAEEGSTVAAAIWDGCDAVVASRLAYPEVRAALAAAVRSHRLDSDQERRARDDWERYWSAVRTVELTQAVAHQAGELASQQSLRGTDAVQLASVLALGATGTIFAVWDERLRAGAQRAGVEVAPITTDTS